MHRRRLLAALTLGWTVVWLQRAAIGPVGPLVQGDLRFDYTLLGLLPSLGIAGACAGYLAAGQWSSRAPRAMLVAGAALLALASLGAASARDYTQLAVGLFVQGFAEGLFYVPALALLLHDYTGAGSGRALGILDSGISGGSVLAFAAAPALATLLGGWRGAFLAAGVLGLAVLPVLAMAAPRAPPERRPVLREALQRRAAPVYASVVLLVTAYFAVLYLAPAFLLTRGFALADADYLTAFAVLIGVPWHVLGGHFADKHGAARVAAGFAVLQGLLTAAMGLPLGLGGTALLLVASYSVGIAGFVALMALVPEVLGHALAAPAFGVFWGIGAVGGFVGPLLMGSVADRAGFGPALMVVGAFAVASGLVLVPMARRGRVFADSGVR